MFISQVLCVENDIWSKSIGKASSEPLLTCKLFMRYTSFLSTALIRSLSARLFASSATSGVRAASSLTSFSEALRKAFQEFVTKCIDFGCVFVDVKARVMCILEGAQSFRF